MSPVVIVSHALALSLEIVLVVAIFLFGMELAPGPVLKWLAGFALSALLIGLWRWLAAPKSATRLGMPALLVFKLLAFGTGALALVAIDHGLLALGFGCLVVLHLTLATRLRVL